MDTSTLQTDVVIYRTHFRDEASIANTKSSAYLETWGLQKKIAQLSLLFPATRFLWAKQPDQVFRHFQSMFGPVHCLQLHQILCSSKKKKKGQNNADLLHTIPSTLCRSSLVVFFCHILSLLIHIPLTWHVYQSQSPCCWILRFFEKGSEKGSQSSNQSHQQRCNFCKLISSS